MTITNDAIEEWMKRFAAEVAENRTYLTKLDGAIGDGDHGTNMDRGMKKALEKLEAADGDDIGASLKTVGMALVSSVGGAAGPLYGTLFLQMGQAAAGKSELDLAGFTDALDAGVQGVIKRGKAEPGDKTMLDALGPALEALRERRRRPTSPARSRGRRRPPARAWRRRCRWSRARGARATSASAAPATRTPVRRRRTCCSRPSRRPSGAAARPAERYEYRERGTETVAKYAAALDQGTTSTRCMIFNHGGEVVSVAQKEHEQIYPKPGWVEHDPKEIWARTQEVMDEALDAAGATADDISGLGITNQRETTVVWDKNTGEPVMNAIVWQDTRTDKLVDELLA